MLYSCTHVAPLGVKGLMWIEKPSVISSQQSCVENMLHYHHASQ